VKIEVRSPQPPFVVFSDNVPFTPDTVTAADGVIWYVFRAVFTSQDITIAPIPGVHILTSRDFSIMNEDQTRTWFEVAGVEKYDYTSCSVAPSFGDTLAIKGQQMSMGRWPGMITEDVETFLILNGVPKSEAHRWAFKVWVKTPIGTYISLPASFTPVILPTVTPRP
jgi:hypothetical protein